jgi:hypothetical protein
MVARVDAIVNARDLALLVDQETDPAGIARLGVVACPIGHTERAIRVAQQREVEAVLFREGGVVFDGVEARAEDHDLVFHEIVLLVAEPAAFGSSARSVGLGVEPEQHFLPTQAIE